MRSKHFNSTCRSEHRIRVVALPVKSRMTGDPCGNLKSKLSTIASGHIFVRDSSNDCNLSIIQCWRKFIWVQLFQWQFEMSTIATIDIEVLTVELSPSPFHPIPRHVPISISIPISIIPIPFPSQSPSAPTSRLQWSRCRI